jgi:hypothetical protein
MSFGKSTSASTVKTSRSKAGGGGGGGVGGGCVNAVDAIEFDLNDFGSPSPPPPGRRQQHHVIEILASDDEEYGYEEEPVRQWPPPRASQADRRAKVEAAAAGTKSDDRDPAILVFEELKSLRHQVGRGHLSLFPLVAATHWYSSLRLTTTAKKRPSSEVCSDSLAYLTGYSI